MLRELQSSARHRTPPGFCTGTLHVARMAAMLIGRRLGALTSWIACFAILLSALAPTWSHSFRSEVPTGWAEICSATGAKLIKLDEPGKSSGEGSDAQAMKHCPYCSTHATVLGLPPAPPTGLILDNLAFHVPELFLAAPRTLFAWASAQPRAPPLNA